MGALLYQLAVVYHHNVVGNSRHDGVVLLTAYPIPVFTKNARATQHANSLGCIACEPITGIANDKCFCAHRFPPLV